jgi:hypothetical protein
MDGLDDALARAREAVRALAASSSSPEGGAAAARAKEASRLLREVERAVEVSESESKGRDRFIHDINSPHTCHPSHTHYSGITTSTPSGRRRGRRARNPSARWP